MANLQILFAAYKYPLPFSAPIDGTLYLREIETDTESDDRNDLLFILAGSENLTGLTASDVSITTSVASGDIDTDPKVVSFRGKNSTYELILRPSVPLSADDDFSETLTLMIAEAATDQGNDETEASFTYTNTIPEAAWQKIADLDGYEDIVSITRERIGLLKDNDVDYFTHDGMVQSSEQIAFPDGTDDPDIDAILHYAYQRYLVLDTADKQAYLLNSANGSSEWASAEDVFQLGTTAIHDWTIGNGRLFVAANEMNPIRYLPILDVHKAIQNGTDLSHRPFQDLSLDNGDVDVENYDVNVENYVRTTTESAWSDGAVLASYNGMLYVATNRRPRFEYYPGGLRTISAFFRGNYIYTYSDEDTLIRNLRFPVSDDSESIAIFAFENYIYRLFEISSAQYLSRLDLSTGALPHPIANIQPQIVSPGGRIDLKKFIRYANDILPEVGFDKPDWMTFTDNRYLDIADDSESESTALIRLRGINPNGITQENTFFFYIYVERLRIPVWKDFDSLNMFFGQQLNMLAFCEDADAVDWVPGERVPTDIDMDDGFLKVTGDAYDFENRIKLRAKTQQGSFADHEFTLNIISADRIDPLTSITSFRYRAIIEGIQLLTDHLVDIGGISSSLDPITPNMFKRGAVQIHLRELAGYYNSEIDGNFWSANNLNRNGYLNRICLFLDYLQRDNWESQGIIFEGVIWDWSDDINESQVTLDCVDSTTLLRQVSLIGKGLGKPMLAMLYPPEDQTQPIAEGTYTPETGVTPLNVDMGAKAYAHDRLLELKDVINQSEGVSVDDSGYLSESDLKTQGGLFGDMPAVLLDFKTAYRQKAAHAIVELIAKVSDVYSVETDFEVFAKSDHISTNGNIAFNTESGRITRFPVDWIYNETNDKAYVLLSNRTDVIADQLVEYDSAKDQSLVLKEFDASVAVLSLASDDFDVFYILVAPAVGKEVDRTADMVDPDTDTVSLNYDSAEGAHAEILRYKHSENQLSTHVATTDNYPPQVGLHYHSGFDSQDFLWQGIQPSARPAFEKYNSELYYRFSTPTEFGVASVDTDGNTTEVHSAERDAYQNHLNFAFFIDAAGEVYFGYTTGTPENSTLFLKDTSGTLLARKELVSNLTLLDNLGGAWLGVYELLVHENFCYFIVPVARNNRDMDKSAGAVLYRYGIKTHQLQVHETWDFAHWGPISLVLHDDAIYYLESPDVSYKFPPRNDALGSWDTETEQNVLPNAKGYLKRIPAPGTPELTPENVGNAWFEGSAFRGTGMKALSFNNALHFVMAEGNPELIGQRSSNTSQPENFQWLTFGKKLNYRLDIPTRGTLYEVLLDVATKTYSTLVLDRGIISIRSRTVLGALIDGDVTSDAWAIRYDNANKAFPDSGYLLINDEIIQYTSKTDTALTGLTRGVAGTTAAVHSDNEEILYCHHVINTNILKGFFKLGLHWNQLYNTVRDSARNVNKVDIESIEKFGERIFGLNLDLSAHKIAWFDFTAEQNLKRFKDVQHYLQLSLRTNFSIRVTDILAFYFGGMLIPLQAMDVSAEIRSTQITSRQVALDIEPQRIPKTRTQRLFADNGSPFLFDNGDQIGFESNRPIAFAGNAVIADQDWKQFERITPVQIPAVSDEGHGDVGYELVNVVEGVYLDARRRMVGIPQKAQLATETTFRATDVSGETANLMFDASVKASRVDYQRIFTDNGSPFLFDNGDQIAFLP